MFESLKLIWSKIPKKWITTLFLVALSILSKHGFDVYFTNAPLLSWPKLLPLIEVSCTFLVIYYMCSFICISLWLISKRTELKKVLPYEHVSIGKYSTTDKRIDVDIQAKIMLNDKVQPDIQNFLNRIALGDPYCHKCSRPIDMLTFKAGAFRCAACNWEKDGGWSDLKKGVHAKIRSDYDHYWEVYQARIREMTGGKPEAFTLPS
jgi:hypothetical protein